MLHNRITPKRLPDMRACFYRHYGRPCRQRLLTFKFTDVQMIRAGQGIIAVGAAAMLLPLGSPVTLTGLVLIGLGCAPIYPCIIHSTPAHFGADRSQALIGVQMACAYVGTCLMPPLFGLLANHISVSLLPVYLLALLVLMAVMHEKLIRKTRKIPADIKNACAARRRFAFTLFFQKFCRLFLCRICGLFDHFGQRLDQGCGTVLSSRTPQAGPDSETVTPSCMTTDRKRKVPNAAGRDTFTGMPFALHSSAIAMLTFSSSVAATHR